ncbi:BNR repeat-containing protein [Caldalkalibacillus salinus]|uniref:BNR repeat-containing protein n=1 Tax=Caldalkalibacillus salinus TaxID=2803787 RepID=UPI0019226F75|nr:BNR repeat-containing protein [Caldalkalibacillus salinus]
MTVFFSNVGAQGRDDLRLVNEQTVTINAHSHDWNTIAYDQYKIVSYGAYQYTGYWDKHHHLNVARRHLPTDKVETVTFPEQVSDPSNTHLNVVVGISPEDGRLHLSFNHHGTDTINYRVSDAGFITSPPGSMTIDHFSDNHNIVEENRITYPRFFNHIDDQLLLMFRQGRSGEGGQYLYQYDAHQGTWSKVGLVFSGQGEWQGSTSRNAYLQDLIFDTSNRLHATWVYREEAYSHSTNHGLYYAYSDDQGMTWYNNNGVRIADLSQNDPIRVDDRGIQVIDIPQNSWILNQAAMTLDSNNQPHLLMSRSKKVTNHVPDTNVHYVHYWRSADGAWHEKYIVDTKNAVGHGPHWTEIFNYRGDIAIDEHDHIYVTLPMPNNMLYAAQSSAPRWDDWTVYALTDAGVTYAGQKYDRRRWNDEQILSVPMTVLGGKQTQYLIRDYIVGQSVVPRAPYLKKASYESYTVTLEWQDRAGAERYDIYRAEDGKFFSKLTTVGAEAFGQFVDTTVNDGRAYTYKLRAINPAGESDDSNKVSVEAT